MKIVQILFLSLVFTILNVMIVQDIYDEAEVDFPKLKTSDIQFRDIGDCGGIASCIKLIGNVLYNIGAGIIAFVMFNFNLTVYIMEFVLLVLDLLVRGIPGAPWFVNLIIQAPLLGGIGIIIYRLIRKGDSDA